MCMCFVKKRQPCVQEKGDVRGGDLSKEVQASEGFIYFEDKPE